MRIIHKREKTSKFLFEKSFFELGETANKKEDTNT